MKIHGVTGNIVVDGILSTEGLEELNSSQLNDARAVQAYWQEHGCGEPYPLIIKPTGYGKGRVIDGLLHPNNQPGVAMLIVGTKNILIEQNQEALRSLVFEETGETRFSILPDTRGPVIVATWQSLHALRKSRGSVPKVDLAIVDEVHNIGTRLRLSLLRWLQPEKVVGLTATAYRASGMFRSPEHYGFRVIDDLTSTLPECIEKRWLSPLMGLCIDTEIILPRDVMSGNEIVGKKLYRELRHHPDLYASIAYEVGTRFLPSGMKTIIVVNRVLEEACLLYKHLERMGFKVGLAVNQSASRMLEGAYVTNGSIARYKLPPDNPDSLQVLISPQVIGEGFDAPATECVVWASPTSSSLRYTQVMGRGARRCRGKAYCLVVDFVYLIEGYGYSMNFAQFFKRTEIKELEGGFMYVGPPDQETPINIPRSFTRGGRVINIVDLSHRIVSPADNWLSVSQLADILGRSINWVNARVDTLGHGAEIRQPKIGKPCPHYPPTALEQLKSMDQVQPAGNWLSLPKLVQLVGHNPKWVATQLKKLGVESEERLGSSNRPSAHYPPTVVEQLRALDKVPQAGDWLTVAAIERLVERHCSWILRQINSLGIKPQNRKLPGGQIVPHYSPRVVEQLRALDKVPPIGNRLTRKVIASKLGRSENWVSPRLKQVGASSDVRQATDGQVVECYDPAVVEQLKALDKVVAAGDWLNPSQIASKIGRSRPWVVDQLTRLGAQAEKREARNKKILLHYPPTVIDVLRSMPEPPVK